MVDAVQEGVAPEGHGQECRNGKPAGGGAADALALAEPHRRVLCQCGDGGVLPPAVRQRGELCRRQAVGMRGIVQRDSRRAQGIVAVPAVQGFIREAPRRLGQADGTRCRAGCIECNGHMQYLPVFCGDS